MGNCAKVCRDNQNEVEIQINKNKSVENNTKITSCFQLFTK